MAKTRATAIAAATANDRRVKTAADVATDADVARRAYDLYLARGREDGHDVEDWLEAERELRRSGDR